jgi:hypothetical protein
MVFKKIYDYVRCLNDLVYKKLTTLQYSKLERSSNYGNVEFLYMNKKYCIRFHHKRKIPIFRVSLKNEEETDITEEFKQFAGPYGNFFNQQLSPTDLGFEEGITVIYGLDMRTKEFDSNEIIDLSV